MRYGLGLGLSVWNSNYLYPSMTLDFLSGSLDPRMTFTRATTATYFGSDGLLKSAAVNVPRFDYDPVTLQPRGILIEENRTNTVVRSAEFDNAVWVKSNATVTANSGMSPAGLMDADALIETVSASVEHEASQAISVTSGTAYTFSCYLKPFGRAAISLGLRVAAMWPGSSNQVVQFTLTGIGSAAVTSGSPSYTITAVGNGWYRCTITSTAAATGTAASRVQWVTAGDGVSGVYVWGAQLEVGAFQTSYIPTSASSVTRGAESAVMTGSNFSGWFNPSEGTFVTEVSIAAFMQNRGFYGLSNGTETDEMFTYCSPSRGILTLTTSGGAFQGDNLMSGVVTAGVKVRYARAYAVNDLQAAADGVLSVPDNIATLPVGLDRMSVGHRSDGVMGFKVNGHISRLQYYNTRLPNSELQRLTA